MVTVPIGQRDVDDLVRAGEALRGGITALELIIIQLEANKRTRQLVLDMGMTLSMAAYGPAERSASRYINEADSIFRPIDEAIRAAQRMKQGLEASLTRQNERRRTLLSQLRR